MRGDEFTSRRLKWLEELSTRPEISRLALQCCIRLALCHVNRDHALATGELLAYPSQEWLADKTGATRDGVAKALRQVEAAGFLHVKAGRGRHVKSKYLLCFPGEKTPMPGGVFDGKKPDERHAYRGPKSPTRGAAKPRQRSEKTPTGVCKNPLKEAYDSTPGAEEELRQAAQRIFAALPIGARECSNTRAITEAVRCIAGEGTPPQHLAIAVETFCRNSPRAKEERGRYMGAPHKWLTETRGWEAYLPSPDSVFLDGRSEDDRWWVMTIRSWQRRPDGWKRRDFGPAPDEDGCEAPAEVLEHCRIQSERWRVAGA
jgi:hypothetical protein